MIVFVHSKLVCKRQAEDEYVAEWLVCRQLAISRICSGNNYESDGLLASVIKVQGGKQLPRSARIPEEYISFYIARYDSIVQGPYASKNMAVIVKKDDLESMLQHAIIRANSKELI